MAIFNETLEGRFNKIITALHGTKGHTPAPQITPEIGHHIILESDRPEYHFLAGSTRYATKSSVGGAAGTFSEVQFLNPANSGTLVVFEHVFVEPASNTGADAFMFPGAIATSPSFGFPLDSREAPTKKSTLVNFINTGLVAQSGNPIDSVFNSAAFAAHLEFIGLQGVVLGPGGVMGVFARLVNTGLNLWAIWRERAISPNELISR
jgi:hypothetical protein